MMKPETPILTIMVALNCEAKPWIDFYRLKKIVDRPFALYARDGLNIEIVVAGIGALNMSTSIGWVGGRTSNQRVWLNIGIAGHLQRRIGQIVRVHSFIDSVDLRRYYAHLVAKWSGDNEALISVNAPTDSYPETAMVDMEGLAFYRSASIFSAVELISSVKVISDNSNNPVDNLNAATISGLMQDHVHAVNQFGERLLALVRPKQILDLPIPLDTIRMTHSQRQQLDRLIEKACVLDRQQAVINIFALGGLKVEYILSQLKALVQAAPPTIGELSQPRTVSSSYKECLSNG